MTSIKEWASSEPQPLHVANLNPELRIHGMWLLKYNYGNNSESERTASLANATISYHREEHKTVALANQPYTFLRKL